MAHELEMNADGTARLFYYGAAPWHNLGTAVDKALTAKEAIVTAGLDWKVGKYPSQSEIINEKTGEKSIAKSHDYFNIVRDRDLRILGNVQGRYEPMQNEDCFDFMDAIAGPSADVRYHTAGSLKGGRQIWMLAKLENFVVEPVKNDISESFLLLSNSHDGKKSLRCFFTTVRVVCANTMRVAINEGQGEGITIRHTGDLKKKREEAQKLLGLAVGEFGTYRDVAKLLAKFQVTTDYFKDFMDYLIPLDPKANNTRRENTRDKIQELFETGRGTHIPGVRGTGWGALQAVTEYNSHYKSYKNTDGGNNNYDDNRLQSLWFGPSDSVNQRAMKKLMADAI